MIEKLGDQNYDLGRFMQRGFIELGNSLYPESSLPVRDHAGMYGSAQHHDVEPSQPDRQVQQQAPELEHDEPGLER